MVCIYRDNHNLFGKPRSGDYVEAAMDRLLSSIPQRTMMVNEARWSCLVSCLHRHREPMFPHSV